VKWWQNKARQCCGWHCIRTRAPGSRHRNRPVRAKAVALHKPERTSEACSTRNAGIAVAQLSVHSLRRRWQAGAVQQVAAGYAPGAAAAHSAVGMPVVAGQVQQRRSRCGPRDVRICNGERHVPVKPGGGAYYRPDPPKPFQRRQVKSRHHR